LAGNAVVAAWVLKDTIDIAALYCSVAALGMEGGKKKRSETNTNTDEVWTRRGREFKQAGSLSWSSE
jgi:hypothetical protein